MLLVVKHYGHRYRHDKRGRERGAVRMRLFLVAPDAKRALDTAWSPSSEDRVLKSVLGTRGQGGSVHDSGQLR